MAKFKRNKNRVSAAEGIVVGGGSPTKPEVKAPTGMVKGSEIGNTHPTAKPKANKKIFFIVAALIVLGTITYGLYQHRKEQQPVGSKDIPGLTPEQASEGVGSNPAGLP